MAHQNAGLYIHVPFCTAKCCYCDFYSVSDLTLCDPWFDALCREIALYRGQFSTFDTVYIGGGTPTVLKPERLDAMLQIVSRHFTIQSDAEITIEANPQDITVEMAHQLVAAGYTRLSLGIQSFDDTVLAFLTRRHTARDGVKAVYTAREAGFKTISIDLVYAVPGQTRAQWHKTLVQAIALAPEHLSCYQLTVKDKTPLQQRVVSGAVVMPDAEMEELFFMDTVSLLASSGYHHYEVSNFARTAELVSRHNQKYWLHAPYLGLGPAAHSFQDAMRWWNVTSVKAYIERLQNGDSAVAGGEKLTHEQLRAERLMLGFRTRCGIEHSFFDRSQKSHAAIRHLAAAGLVRVRNGRVLPTTRGMLVADSMPHLFL
ncbi:MAG: radical SAM family heme chaperone HemW [Desulfobacterota bacterium]|nr:radical SAM family heme chaperone HemW [Thermodesulfobacteriota bacterium]